MSPSVKWTSQPSCPKGLRGVSEAKCARLSTVPGARVVRQAGSHWRVDWLHCPAPGVLFPSCWGAAGPCAVPSFDHPPNACGTTHLTAHLSRLLLKSSALLTFSSPGLTAQQDSQRKLRAWEPWGISEAGQHWGSDPLKTSFIGWAHNHVPLLGPPPSQGPSPTPKFLGEITLEHGASLQALVFSSVQWDERCSGLLQRSMG